MTTGPDADRLAALHAQLEASMEAVHRVIEDLDGVIGTTKDDWTSRAAHDFGDAWHNGFKPSLAKLCQALAAAGTDVSVQHQHAEGDASPDVEQPGPLASPR